MTSDHNTKPLTDTPPPPHLQESTTTTSTDDSDSYPPRTYPVPSTSSCLSSESIVSELKPEVQDSRQAFPPTGSPTRAQSPVRSQRRRSRRRAGCWTPQKGDDRSSHCKPPTAESQLQVSTSARFVIIYVRHVC